MTVIVTLYWSWFAISLAILARRLVRRLLGGSSRASSRARSLPVAPGPAGDVAPDGVDPNAELEARVRARVAALAGGSATDLLEPDLVEPALVEPVPAEPVLLEPVPAEPALPEPAHSHASLAGTVFAGLPRPVRSPIAGARVSLAEALQGIRMPEELVPLVHVDGIDLERRVVLATQGRSADDVGAALADELRRLGYGLEATGPADVIARRGDDQLSVHLRVIGPAPKKGPPDAAYPTAVSGSIVVDLQLR